LRKRAQELINTEYGRSDKIAIKDPRMCITLPFWKEVLHHLEYKIRVILIYRELGDIVASLHTRDMIKEDHGTLLTVYQILKEHLLVMRIVLQKEAILSTSFQT